MAGVRMFNYLVKQNKEAYDNLATTILYGEYPHLYTLSSFNIILKSISSITIIYVRNNGILL